MGTRKLPHPATTQDEYSHAIVEELRELNDSLRGLVMTLHAALQPVPEFVADDVPFQEPAKAKPKHRDEKRAADKAQ